MCGEILKDCCNIKVIIWLCAPLEIFTEKTFDSHLNSGQLIVSFNWSQSEILKRKVIRPCGRSVSRYIFFGLARAFDSNIYFVKKKVFYLTHIFLTLPPEPLGMVVQFNARWTTGSTSVKVNVHWTLFDETSTEKKHVLCANFQDSDFLSCREVPMINLDMPGD